jgi:SAM-dependent methyltransferase
MDLREIKKRDELIIQKRHPWEIARVNVVKDLLKRNFSHYDGKAILDIGCGDTFVVEELALYLKNSDFYAIDTAFTDEVMEVYRNKISNPNIHLFKSLEEALLVIQKEVALITLLDVVEHIEDDIQFLSNLSKSNFMTNETEILITVPAFQSLFCSHDTFLGHYRRYTNGLLQKHIEKSGLKKVSAGYFFSSLLLPRVFQVWKEKLSPDENQTTGLVEWNGSKAKTKFISNILFFDYKIGRFFKYFGLNIIGLSNYMICKKSV